MNIKFVATFIGSLTFCFLINIFSHHDLIFAFYNSFLYGLSYLLVFKFVKAYKKSALILTITTCFIPLFNFIPDKQIVYIFLYTYIILFALGTLRYNRIIVAVALVLLLWGTLITNNILTFPIKPDRERLIFNDRVTQEKILYHQKDARYVPYKLRLVLFNKSVYFYSFFTTVANFLTLKNLYDTILLVNIYPLITGSLWVVKNKREPINGAILIGLFLTFVVISINTSPDKFGSLFIASPLIFYLVVSGLQKVNKNIYLVLLIFSLILRTSPV